MASAIWQPDESIILNTPFDRSFVEALKSGIPYRCREWDPDRKVWAVDAEFAWLGLTLFKKHFPHGVVVDAHGERERQQTRPSGSTTTGNSDCRTLYVTDDAPFEVIKAAYNALAKLHHPDKGGDTTKMQQINAAYERLSFGKKRSA